jgi:Zn-dependent protease with chaperone function
VTDERFAELVHGLEARAKRDPAGYKARVLAIALLGNAYLAGVVALIAVLFFVALASAFYLKALGVKLALVAGVFLWMVLKALWIVIPAPEGTPIGPRDAPELFALIETLRRALRAPRFHRVLVTDELNAGVVQAPRLGIFGWPRNYLLIGLPLMKALTVEQFKAVLAHEFGHLARGHGRLSNWIYRQRLRWSRLMHTLEAVESKGAVLFQGFLRWYAPYFNAYSFPLARANEFEADATSARLASSRVAAEALTGVEVVGAYLGERYWPGIHRQADDLPQPAFAPFSGMGRMAIDIDAASMQRWLERALERTTTLDDTHPALRERLEALGEEPRLALPAEGAAADALLGKALAPLSDAFDRRWHEGVLPAWQRRHAEVQEGRRRLAELDAKHASGAELAPQEAYDRAMLTESVGGSADGALEQLRALQARLPDDPVVLYQLGARLLGRDDERGCALLERAMQLDAGQTVRVCEALRDHAWHAGRKEEAHEWHRKMVARAELEQAAAKERNEVRLDDKFERHDLSPEALAALRAQLQAVRRLKKAYFLKKRVAHMSERPCYVLGFTVGSFFHWYTKRRAAEVLQRVKESVAFPAETLILNVEGGNYRFGRKFRWMRGSRIV